MHSLKIRLFGDVAIRNNGELLPALPAKALELLCYLLVHSERVHHREALADLLWPAGQRGVSKRYLRQALWKLNTALSARESADSDRLLVLHPDRIRVNIAAAWVDLHVFEQAMAAVRDTSGHLMSAEQAQQLRAAVDLYQGELLATSAYDWSDQERDRLQLSYLAALEQLMDYCETHYLFGEGIAYGSVVLRSDPAREATHRRLMRLSYRAGDRTSAMRQYDRCTRIIAEEFGVEPSGDTVALYEQICADRVVGPAAMAVPASAPSELSGADAFAGLHSRLDQIQASLADLSRRFTGYDGTGVLPHQSASEAASSSSAG